MSATTAFGRATPSCPDCHHPLVEEVQHDAGCPLARAVDEAVADDSAWFSDHPGAQRRRRPPVRAEVVEAMAARGVILEPHTQILGEIVVHAVRPGVRVRDVTSVFIDLTPRGEGR